MSYLVLARKCRPQSFEDVIGQQPVVRTLQNAIERDRVPHGMIFSGVRGVGKTTLARIMAKALNCESGPTRTPCNSCDSCREITAGSAIDLHEIDGASNRGIQEIRELKENIRFFPTKARFKIIIIDEVHMLTPEAFNALLKTLEEPPAHVIFMFATTEQHKIPITILSRCQRYELKRVSFNELAAFFKKIARNEKVEIADQAIDLVVREAEGSVRDGLSLLDQIFSFGDDKITEDDVIQVLGLVDSQVIGSLAAAILAGNMGESLEILDRAYSFGIDLKRFTNDLLARFRALIMCKVSVKPGDLLDLADHEIEAMRKTAADFSVETLFHYFHLLLSGVEEMRYSSHPRLVLETTIIKAVQAGNVVPVATLLERLDGFLRDGEQISSEAKTEKSVSPAAFSEPPPEKNMEAVKKPPVKSAPTIASDAGAETAVKKKTPEVTPEVELPAAPESPDGAVLVAKDSAAEENVAEIRPRQKEVRRHWDEFIDYVMDRKKWMGHILRLSSGVREEGLDLILKFDDSSDCKMLQSSENKKFFTEFCQDFFQKEFQIKIKIKGGEIQGSDGPENGKPQEERRALANDPLVQMAAEVLGGQVVNIRTGPRSR